MGALFGNLDPLLHGLLTTLQIAGIAGTAFAHVQLFLNVPLLALLVLFVFALPDVGLLMPLTTTVIVVLVLYEAAYVAEAVRSGVNTVAVGQGEAARALGLSFLQSLRLVILPQALRAVVQPLGNVLIALVMNSALAAAVGVVELTSATNKVNLVEAQPIPIFAGAGVLYMLVALAIGLLSGVVERRTAILR